MSQLRTLTWADYEQYSPCYNPAERYGEFTGSIIDILKDDRIPDDDKIWAFTREGIVDDRTLRLFACRCVREVWHLLTDERSRNAVEVAERYADGLATDEDLEVARKSARKSAAARDAAWASVAARDAALATVAARESALASEWDMARSRQVQIAIELMEGGAK